MNIDTPTLDSAGLRRFLELGPDAVTAVSLRFFAEHGAALAHFGPRAREACREDLAFHLEFLRPVLEFGIVQPMVDYLRWLAQVLATRGVPALHIPLSLDWFSGFFTSTMETTHGRIVEAALGGTKRLFLEGDDALPAFYARMPQAWPECEAFEGALLAGDRHGAQALLGRCLDKGHGLVDAEMHMIQPALYAIGKKWQNNQVTVAQEHLATAIAQSLMSQALASCEAPPPNGRSVLLACVEGNNHSVGLQMVADAFQLGGWEVQYLGANVPTTALLTHIGRYRPSLLALSVSFPQQLRVVKDLMARLVRLYGAARVPVIVGGLAINQFDRLASQLGADAWSPDARAAVEAGSNLATQRTPI